MVEPHLPIASWQSRADLVQLLQAIDPHGTNCRFVGGAVRDTLLGLPVADIDIATRLRPDIVIGRGEAAGVRMVPTGIAHGTVTAALPEGPVELTTLRRDVSTDGRRADVEFSNDWKEDAARRDFTINALYANPQTSELFDYFGGMDDLKARRVRFIGDPHKRIHEDYLRIMRFFRFSARFAQGKPDEEAMAACAELAPAMKALSRERISMELLAILALPDPVDTCQRMARACIWPHVLPELAENGIERLELLVQREKRLGIAPDSLTRLASLLPPEPGLVEKTSARLRLSRAKSQALVSIAHALKAKSLNIPTLAWRQGVEQTRRIAMLAETDDHLMATLRCLENFRPPQFAIKGRDVIAAGIAPGPQVSRTLRACEQAWIEAGFPDEAKQRALLDQIVQSIGE